MRRDGTRAVAALAGVIAFTAMSTVIPGAATGPQAHADDTGSAVTVTRKIITNGAVDMAKAQTRTATFSVSQTTSLAPRQTLTLSWTGANPSHDFTTLLDSQQPATEYPVVLAQCWGSDADRQLDPTHCETNSQLNGLTKGVVSDTNALDPPNSTDVTPPLFPVPTFPGELRFHSVDGKTYDMTANSKPPELLEGATPHNTASIPGNAVGEWSDANGSRTNLQFQVHNVTTYPGTGCSDNQTCTLVMVPITDPACVPNLPATDNCTKGPLTPVGPGTVRDHLQTNAYLQQDTWWLQTNWRNRLSVPLTFLGQNLCSVTDNRRGVPIDGSEVASVAMINSWGPDFCLDPKKFKLQYIQQPEPAARQSLTTDGPGGFAADAVLTTLPVTGSPRPLVHAPVLDTGFAVSFQIDDSSQAPVTSLRLTPLLLAKLITESYPRDSDEPALTGNPKELFVDPEFLAVNPGFKLNVNAIAGRDLGTNIILPSPTQTDTIWALTSYINAAPEARAWLDGQPDGYSGMVVNPAYRGITLPELANQLLDTTPDPATFTHPPTTPNGVDPGADLECIKGATPAYFNLMSEGVAGLDDAYNAMLNLQDPAQDVCDHSASSATEGLFFTGQPQVVGNRSLMAIVSTGQAAQGQLPTAQLQVHDVDGRRTWAAPTSTAMQAALAFTTEDKTTGVLSLDFPHLSTAAYPGTMPVYAAIPTSGLTRSQATDYASFLRFAVTDGQTPGNGIGNLEPGYAPLPQALRDFTMQVADDVATQDGKTPVPPPNLPQQIRNELGATGGFGAGGAGSGGLSGAGTGTGNAPGAGSSPGAGPGHGGSAGADGSRATTVAATRGTDSWLAAWGLPMLLGVGLLAGVGVPLVRVGAQPGHPVRLFLGTQGGRLAGLFRRSA
jgi:hypothetical protein